jgi:hypothetical protein
VYVSDSKLDMLFDQADRGILKRVAAEVSVDIKIAGLTLRGADDPGPTRMAKLRVVERYIDAHNHVGTILDPGSDYFRGTMSMGWEWVGGDQGVWFQGNDYQARQCIGLGGSRYHVLGELRTERQYPYSGWPAIERALKKQKLDAGYFEKSFANSGANAPIPEDGRPKVHWLHNSGMAYDRRLDQAGPLMRLEFLAIPLAEATVALQRNDKSSRELIHVVIGTPLYVRMAGDLSGGSLSAHTVNAKIYVGCLASLAGCRFCRVLTGPVMYVRQGHDHRAGQGSSS